MRLTPIQRDRARQLRARMTEAERRLWRALRAHRFRDLHFRRQASMGSCVVDFVSHAARLVVEVDGGQHAGSQADIRRDLWLKSQGYHVLRFWNTDVLRNLSGVLDRIGAALPPPLPSPTRGEGAGAAPVAWRRDEAGGVMTAVVFDVGNVLIRWEPRLVWADDFRCSAELDAFLAEIGFDAWNLEQDRGRSWAEGIAAACAAHPRRRALIEKFHRDWHRAVPGAIDGAVQLLDKLHAAGVPLYAITNFSGEKWAECRGRFPFLASYFRDVVVSGHARLVKPDPAIFELFLARNGLGAEDCIFVDDGPRNVAMAEILGFDAILFDEPVRLAGKLRVRGLPV